MSKDVENLRKNTRVLNHANVNEENLFSVNNVEPKFKKCWLSLIRALVRANGDIFPCVMRACNNAKPIENILTCNNVENIYLGQMLYHNCNYLIGYIDNIIIK